MNLLLSDEYPSSIGAYVYNSDYYYVNREFEYIPEFEFKCLEQFNICKSLYESLTIWEKDKVIKYWVKQFDSHFEEEITFSPKYIKEFDLITFHEVDPNDFMYSELENTDPYPTFYLNYYTRKFRFLLINFFLFEEQCSLDELRITDYTRQVFDPREFLNLPDIILPVKFQNEKVKFRITQKTIVCFLHLLRDSELRDKDLISNENYCKLMCKEFKLKFGPKMPKIFSYEHFDQIKLVKSQIFPTLDEDVKIKLEAYIISKGYS